MRKFSKTLVMSAAAAGLLLGGAGVAAASAGAEGAAVGSPGVLSGNLIQVPIHIPINLCGDTIDVIGVLNPAFGNTCINNDTTV
ncbi:chaplin [Kitasatospora acidiphila]|uniref:Chaplin n=1 Tax=Kitasatospora acidiphila TaxID=2567942 RepID=A0A540W7B4_9ACTN|nr:chaplin [Kitasatospora acidiphila]TQF04915.1 chaplin [Kitasatospora acidiphila]